MCQKRRCNRREKVMKITKKATKCIKKMMAAVAAALLCMALWMGTFTADAADDSTIDTTKKGSITVTKYGTTYKNHANDEEYDENATGTTDDADIDADKYTTVAGVTFELYKIADEDAVKNYYNGSSTKTYTKDDVKDDAEPDYTKTTDEDGVCKFKDLPVGIYVLKEAKNNQPSQISTQSETSVISIPMVNTATSNNNYNSKWIYDVYVYPKNTIAPAGTLVLTKQDQDGSALANTKFELYKKDFNKEGGFAQDADWTLVNGKDASGNDVDYHTTGEDGTLTVESLSAGEYGTQYKLVEIEAPDGYIVNKTPIYFKVSATNTMAINSTEGDANECNNANTGLVSNKEDESAKANVTLNITVKNEIPSLEKKVATDSANTAWANDAAYQMGDNITYRIIAKVPANITELNTFKIDDVPCVGITDNIDSIAVAYGGAKDECTTPMTKADDYTVTVNAATIDTGKGFTLALSESGAKTVAGKYIQITYSAYMNADAEIAGSGNNNNAKLTYSKYIANEGDTTSTYDITDTTRVYTYQAKITKYLDSVKGGNEATGVEFKLLDADGNDISVTKVVDGEYKIAVDGAGAADTMVTASDGTIVIKGLMNTTYKLKETKTLANYNLLSEPYEFKVDVTETTTWEDGTVYSVVKTYKSTTYTDGEGSPLGSDPTVAKSVINKKGFTLPKTGSMGFILFCFVGLVLIVGGAALIFSGRKKIR